MDPLQEQLVQKAISVITEQGYQKLSLRKLTKAIGLTTGAFYKHFKSKEDLFQKVTFKLSQQFIEQIDLTATSPEQELLQVADYFVEQVQKQPNLMDFLFFNEQAISSLKEVNSTYPFLAKIRHLVQQVNNQAAISNQDFFMQLWAFIQGYALLVKNKVTTYNPQLVQTTFKQLMKEAK